MSILHIKNLKKSYANKYVLNGVNLEIKEPGIYALIGPNGAGKSTLFNLISNLISPSEGEITVLGKSNKNPEIFYKTSFLKDNRVLYDYLSGYDHLNFIKNAQNIPASRIKEVIDKLGIESFISKKTGEYSLGMKQILLIAMAMLNKPRLMILDEPFNGLDPTAVIKVRNLFEELKENGTTILISSHTLSEIDRLTDKIMFLKDGKIIFELKDARGKTAEERYMNIFMMHSAK